MQSVIAAGTIEYMAPEVANNVVVTAKADIWCLSGLTAYLVARRFRPTSTKSSEKIKVAMEGTLEISDFDSLSTRMKDFLNACLKVDHSERPEVGYLKSMSM
nr:ribosomal protein s kinase alpha [Hymenolepis microstoma]CUU98429.1 ribosomal protein s kinase alpha [Hymenolepis microstoma]